MFVVEELLKCCSAAELINIKDRNTGKSPMGICQVNPRPWTLNIKDRETGKSPTGKCQVNPRPWTLDLIP
jgi:hypothetical protein